MSIHFFNKKLWKEITSLITPELAVKCYYLRENTLLFGHPDGSVSILDLSDDNIELLILKQQETIIDVINKFRPDVPVLIGRIADLTNLSFETVLNHISTICSLNTEIGEYLELEQVFIKSIKETVDLKELQRLYLEKETVSLQCVFCKGILLEKEDEQIFVCDNCSKTAPICEICKSQLTTRDEIVISTSCEHFFHKSHIEEWLKIKKTCPVCKKRIEIKPSP